MTGDRHVRRVLLVTRSPTRGRGLADRLPDATVHVSERVDAARAAQHDCVWVDADLPDALAMTRAVIDAGVPAVLGGRGTLRTEDLDDLAQRARRADTVALVGGIGAASLAMIELRRRVHERVLGGLMRVTVRQPGGRRVPRASSTRTPFDRDNQVRWSLGAESEHRIRALCYTGTRIASLVVPNAQDALRPVTVAADESNVAASLAGTQNGVSVRVDVDTEIRGEATWEVEAVCERGTLTIQWKQEDEFLLVHAPLRNHEPVASPRRDPDELLIRHVLARGARASGFASLRGAATVARAVDAMLDETTHRAATRPWSIALLHLPRFRNRADELRLPSLAIARLAAFLRGHSFQVHVVDLEATCAQLDLTAFADDARVDTYLRTHDDAGIDAALNAMWPLVRPHATEHRLMGISVVDYFGHFQMNLASCLAHRAKRHADVPIVLGGERDQVDGERGLGPGMPFDYVVEGDGEMALLELAHLHCYGDRRASEIAGVWSRDGDKLIRNKLVRSHLNAMPRPDFDGVPLDAYAGVPTPELMAALRADGLAPDTPPAPFVYFPYGFVKGCVAKCTFCSAKEYLDVQSPEKSVDELLALRDRYGVRDFVFLNNLVNIGTRWLQRFCRGLIDAQADIQWTDSCRPVGIDPDLAMLMRESGCLLLNFGAESGSDAILSRMRKGLSSRDIRATLANTHRAGIINRVNLIAGYFHETDADVDATIDMLKDLSPAVDVIGCFQGFYLFPGMGVDADAEGIVLHEGSLDSLKTGQATLAYDEVGGRTWTEKRDAIDRSRNRTLDAIRDLGIREDDKINEYDLFYLSRRFDKATVARYLLTPPPQRSSFPNQTPLPPGGVRGRVLPVVPDDGLG